MSLYIPNAKTSKCKFCSRHARDTARDLLWIDFACVLHSPSRPVMVPVIFSGPFKLPSVVFSHFPPLYISWNQNYETPLKES